MEYFSPNHFFYCSQLQVKDSIEGGLNNKKHIYKNKENIKLNLCHIKSSPEGVQFQDWVIQQFNDTITDPVSFYLSLLPSSMVDFYSQACSLVTIWLPLIQTSQHHNNNIKRPEGSISFSCAPFL